MSLPPDPAPAPAPAVIAAAPAMNSNIPFPEKLKLTGNMRENVDNFKDSFEIYLIASGLELQEERVKIATFKAALGLEARKIFNLWPLQPEEQNTVAACLASLSQYMVPQKDVKLARYEFYQCQQQSYSDTGEEESMSHFINRVRELVKDCNFGVLEDEMLRDKIITGILDVNLKKRFISEQNLTSAMVISQCRTEEATKAEMERQHLLQPGPSTQHINKVGNVKKPSQERKKCKFCGKAYHQKLMDCPARGVVCNYCKQRNHYAAVCQRKEQDLREQGPSTKSSSRRAKQIHTVLEKHSEQEEGSSDEESVTTVQYLYSIKHGEETMLKRSITFFDLKKHPLAVSCILDSAASCNVIGKKNAMKILGTDQLRLDNQRAVLKAFGGSSLKSLGRTVIACAHGGGKYKLVFHVVDFEQPPLLSKNTCMQLKLIQVCYTVCKQQGPDAAKQILDEHPDVFEGLGRLEGDVHLEIDGSIKPVIQQPRRIAVTLREELRQALSEMEQQGIIAEQKEHTDWVSNLVLVKRNNKLRVCIDPIILNKALKRPHYQMPTMNELLPELAKAKVFTTVDAKSGFWQVCLDEESSRLTTFWTPFGRYRWLRMPFGISPAPEIFQKKLHEAIHGLRNVRALADDVLIFGCGETAQEAMRDHNENLKAFLQRMQERGVKLNGEKVKLCQDNVKFFGHILTSEGVRADPDKINSILQMNPPKDVPSLLRFLGMVTYLTNYLPSLASAAEPLRRLTNKDEPWAWNEEQEEAYQQLKRMVTSAPILRYFDMQKDVVIQCDSSSVGLGAVLLQDGHPVVYASKTLSATERKYAQIEKETLAILFACRKFEMYIIGKPVTVQTDHQPLIRIFQKPLVEAPLRIQRMLLALQRYDTTLRFTPGKEVVIADMLSRAAIADGDETSKEIYDVYALEYIPISDDRIQQIKMESKQDPEIQTIIQFVIDGWPSRAEVPESLQVYWPFRDEFNTHNGLVFRNDRILIPRSLRKEILERLHQSHSGIEATSKLARDTVFWPGINDQIRQKVQQCEICQKFSPNQQPQPMQSHQMPSYPFQKLSMDICEVELGGRKTVYLITVDHYSDYFDIDELTSLSSATIIKACKKNFARFGRPQIVSTDNGVQFISEEFQRFALDWGFKHTVSAPYHQQANGKAESAVKIAKLLLKKAYESKKDFWDLLLQWRNTPNKCDSSPVQRLLNRRTRFGVPMAEKKYLPKIEEGVEEKIKKNRQEAKLYYDRKAKTLPSLEIGQPVFVKLRPDDKEWKNATVIEPVTDRSSIVAVGGREYRRDNTLIKPAHPNAMVYGSTSGTTQGIKEEPLQNQQLSTPPSPSTTSTVVGLTRPRRAIQVPKRFDDFEMF